MNNNIFMSIFVALGAILMVCMFVLRAVILLLPVIVIVAIVGMLIYSIRKNRQNKDD